MEVSSNVNKIWEIDLDDSISNKVLSSFEKYKHNEDNLVDLKNCCSNNGIQTYNILQLEDFKQDKNLQECLKEILDVTREMIGLNLYHYWGHFIEYYRGGYQEVHNHAHNEHFSSVLYLNNCRGGETYFNFKPYVEKEDRNSYRVDPFVSISPKKNRMIVFPGNFDHGAKKNSSWFINKKVLVLGMRVLDD